LESTRLAEREIAAGRLVAPLAGRSEDIRYTGHYLVFPPSSQRREPLKVFARWLVGELSIALSCHLE
jgi:DNA-binding transcriptional LysR family regulator